MPEYGISVDSDGTIKFGDLENPKFMVTPAQWATWVQGRTIEQVQALATQFASKYGLTVTIEQLVPLRVTVTDRDRPTATL